MLTSVADISRVFSVFADEPSSVDLSGSVLVNERMEFAVLRVSLSSIVFVRELAAVLEPSRLTNGRER